jgi:UDP-N-acetylmuramyl pentapeptide phosphotransferase/UDP-N-acetylglucosamine-1-phosphate transferase
MTAQSGIIAAAFGAFVLGFLLCRLVMALGVKDAPSEARKAAVQKHAVPTAGGVGVAIAALLAAFVVSGFVDWRAAPGTLSAAQGALPFLVLGFVDDRMRLDSMTKLGLMLLFALVLVLTGVSAELVAFAPGFSLPLPTLVAAFGSMIWIILVVNAVNFMDGANGLSMGMAAIAAAGLAILAAMAGLWDVATLALALAGALGGFLIWNVRGRLFVGDAGALFVGALLASVSLLVVRARPDWVLTPPTVLAPYLVDVILTVLWRARQGKPLFSAHRDHAYQIAMKAGLKHWQVAAIHAVWAVNAAGLGVMAVVVGGWAPLAVFVALILVSSWIHLRIRRMGERNNLVGANIA